jgi:tripartite-type tricarboxylate transporter receptor subunit TctC
MDRKINRRDALALGAVAAVAPSLLRAQGAYPNKPLRLIVPFPTGGTTDVVARIFNEALAKELGQPVIVENRGGAGGSIGARVVAGAAADGYTIGLVTISTHGTNSAVYKKLPYDAVRDFTPITKLLSFPGVIAVHPSFPAKNFAEFMALLRAGPGRYSYASSGAGGATNLCMELFKFLTKTFMTHIPYRGSGPALNDVVAGQVPILWDALPSALPFIKSGRLVAIGVAAEQRSAQLPNVPTFTELGVKNYEPDLWNGLVAPANLPRDMLTHVHTAAVAAANRPEVKVRFEELGARVVGNSSAEFAKSIQLDVARWQQIAKFANISLD